MSDERAELLVRIERLKAEIATARTSFVQRFAADMRECGIHVGLGDPAICVTCGLPWPCPEGDPAIYVTCGLPWPVPRGRR